eukprot:5077399-Pleurochrysis_carterae.AAC.1
MGTSNERGPPCRLSSCPAAVASSLPSIANGASSHPEKRGADTARVQSGETPLARRCRRARTRAACYAASATVPHAEVQAER